MCLTGAFFAAAGVSKVFDTGAVDCANLREPREPSLEVGCPSKPLQTSVEERLPPQKRSVHILLEEHVAKLVQLVFVVVGIG